MNPLDRLLNKNGRLQRWPKRGKIPFVLDWLIEKFELDRTYSEKEVNELLNDWHTFTSPSNRTYKDAALLRRELVDYRYLVRDDLGQAYRRNRSEETATLQREASVRYFART